MLTLVVWGESWATGWAAPDAARMAPNYELVIVGTAGDARGCFSAALPRP